ncbi:hypothetical protein [Phytopseudomonas dryadis]|uniref:Lipoprotein n=1 Tax=Phytopseudomonas dryadis TaxID=2487520 RepID=A0A4Q9QV71_9GAMM|nr:hypothetical protein [Pseudomonas dryadis]TBU86486.1 hypothetical protein DNK44_22800 [Pseudomonas dryadis]
MHRYLSGLVLALSIGGCDNKAALTADEQRLLLSDQDFASFGVSRGGHYGKSVQYLTRTVELSYSHSADTGFYLYSGVTLHPMPAMR